LNACAGGCAPAGSRLRPIQQHVREQRELFARTHRSALEVQIEGVTIEGHEHDIGESARPRMVEVRQTPVQQFRHAFLDREPQRRAVTLANGGCRDRLHHIVGESVVG
jgi:hypothetical protein